MTKLVVFKYQDIKRKGGQVNLVIFMVKKLTINKKFEQI